MHFPSKSIWSSLVASWWKQISHFQMFMKIVVDNLSLLVDESGDVVEVSLLHREKVCSEAKLHLQCQHPPPEPLDLPYLRNVEKTFPWSNIFVKFSSCEKPPANTCSPLFLCLRLFHFITTNSDALPIYNIHLISSTWICYFFIYSSFFMLRYIFTFQHLKTYRYHIFSDLQPANILHKLVLQLLLENLYWALFVDFQIIAIEYL